MPRKKRERALRIGPIDVPVRFVPEAVEEYYGEWVKHHPDGPHIHYSCPEPVELKASTLFHEGLHALSDLFGPESLTEEQVQFLEGALPKFIVDNWETFRPLFKKLNGGKRLP